MRRSALRAVVVMAVAAVLISLGAAALSFSATRAETRRTEDVAAALAEPVAQRVLAEGRAESARAAREVLRGANTRLIANRLPIVPEPPPETLSQVVSIQASRALLLADLGSVDVIAAGLRNQFGEDGAFPAAFLDDVAVPDPIATAERGDVVVPTLPGGEPTVVTEPPAARVPPRPQPSGAPTGPTARSRAPAPAAPPRRAPAAPAPERRPAPLLPGVRLPPLIG